MTLEHYYYIGELVAAAALIVSLVYLAVQVKLSTAATKATASQSFVDTTAVLVGGINQSANLGDILFRGSTGLDSLSGGETIQFSAFHDCSFISYESNFFLSQQGILDNRLWNTYQHALVNLLHHKGVLEWWEARSHMYAPEFVEHVKRLRDDMSSKPMYSMAPAG